ncbi:MAG TPA: hypothetical protein VF446_11595 [Trinickia sp.]
MGIETVSPTSPSPDLTPSESAHDVRQDSPRGQPSSTPSTAAGGRLEHLSSLQASRPLGQAGPSQVRKPQADALAKLARPSSSAPLPHRPTVQHAAPGHAVAAPTHADAAAVRQRAQALGDKEAQLAALRRPPEPRQAEAAQPASEAEVGKLIDQLEAKRGSAQENVSVLAQQCKAAFDKMARHGIVLARKVDLLEQYQAKLDEAGPASATPARPRPSAAATTVPDRMAALENEIRLLKGSRKAVAQEALAVANRDKLKELGTWSALGTASDIAKASFKSLFSKEANPVNEQLERSIDAWIDSWTPERTRRRDRSATPGEQFKRAADDAFRRIEDAAGGEANSTDAMQALAGFFHLMSQLEVEPFADMAKTGVVRQIAIYLIGVNLEHQFPFTVRKHMPGYRPFVDDEGGLAQKAATTLMKEADGMVAAFGTGPSPTKELLVHDQVYRGQSTRRAFQQFKVLAEHLRTHKDALVTVLASAQRTFAEELKAIDPAKAQNDELDKLGREVAPKLPPVYDGMIQRLGAERAQLAKTPMRRSSAAPAIDEAATASHAGPDRERLEIIVSRLQGAVLEYADKHRETFEMHATLSARHMDASDELEGIERQLGEAHETMQGVRTHKRRRAGESAARGQQAASLEREIESGLREALADPALSRLISPTALGRALKMHVAQTPAQMRARVRHDNRTARTGTFRSGVDLLRVIAEISEHELGRPESALRATTRQAFDEIAGRHPGGRINALHDHGRTIGHGVRASDAADAPPSRTGTSQYAIAWAEGEGARISHLHPWVSPY